MVEPSTLTPFACNSLTSFRVSIFRSFAYEALGDSSPIQIHETPNATISSIVYLRMALADEKT